MDQPTVVNLILCVIILVTLAVLALSNDRLAKSIPQEAITSIVKEAGSMALGILESAAKTTTTPIDDQAVNLAKQMFNEWADAQKKEGVG